MTELTPLPLKKREIPKKEIYYPKQPMPIVSGLLIGLTLGILVYIVGVVGFWIWSLI